MAFEAQVTYTANGVDNDFTVTFGYLKKSHVSLFIDGVEDQTFTWIDATSIAATTTPADQAEILITRTTPRDALVYEIPNSGTYKGADLNNQALQALYIAAEGYDALNNTIALDTGDNKWDADTKRIKNVVDPVDAQDVATKNYADTNGSSFAAQALASANAAALSESNASTSASTASSAAGTASSSAGTASTAASDASTDASNALADSAAAEDWAIQPEDSLVPASSGGNEVDEYSALHWAKKAEADGSTAVSEATAAVNAVSAINAPEPPRNATELMRGEDGFAMHFLARDYVIYDYDDLKTVTPAIIAHNAPWAMNTTTPNNITDRSGATAALSANEVPYDHSVASNIVTPEGMYVASGAHYMTGATVGSTFNVTQDNFTWYIEWKTNSFAGTNPILDYYTTGVGTDSYTFYTDGSNIKIDWYAGSALQVTMTLSGATVTTGTVLRSAFRIDGGGRLSAISTGMSAVQNSTSGLTHAATPTDLTIGTATGILGWVRKIAHYGRAMTDDEMKLLCGIS